MPNHGDNEELRDDAALDRNDESRRDKRVIGKGMTSPDSTQVPLKAETGEPDLDAIRGRVGGDENDESRLP